MCEGSASIAVDRDGVEGACDEHEVLPVGLLTRPRSDRGRSCERVNGLLHRSRLVRDEEDVEGEIAEDAVEEEII